MVAGFGSCRSGWVCLVWFPPGASGSPWACPAGLGLGFRLGWVGGGVGAGPPLGSLASFSRPRSSFSSWVSFSHLRPPILWVYGAAVISGRRAVPYFGLVFRVRLWLGGRPGSRGWARPPFPLCATKGWPPFAKSVVQLLEPPGGWSQTFVRTLVAETRTVNVRHGRPRPAMASNGWSFLSPP